MLFKPLYFYRNLISYCCKIVLLRTLSTLTTMPQDFERGRTNHKLQI